MENHPQPSKLVRFVTGDSAYGAGPKLIAAGSATTLKGAAYVTLLLNHCDPNTIGIFTGALAMATIPVGVLLAQLGTEITADVNHITPKYPLVKPNQGSPSPSTYNDGLNNGILIGAALNPPKAPW